MRNYKRFMSTALLSACLFSNLNISASSAQSLCFKDVAQDHWARSAIEWASDNQTVDGYPDGTFKPDQPVGQKEFLAMLIRTYKPTEFTTEGNQWTDWGAPYINYAGGMGWYGALMSPTTSDITKTRMYIAKLITNASGRNYNFQDSIQFLLDTNISEGKTDKSIDGYQMQDSLTRAEAVTFIKNLNTKLDMLYRTPLKETKYDPSTAALSPAENWTLEVNQPPGDGMIKFSSVTLDNPKQGYEKVTETKYRISGKVQNRVGDKLEINVGWKNPSGGIVDSTKHYVNLNEDGTFSTEINLGSDKGEKSVNGLYRVSIYSPADIHHKEGMVNICMFYLDYYNNNPIDVVQQYYFLASKGDYKAAWNLIHPSVAKVEELTGNHAKEKFNSMQTPPKLATATEEAHLDEYKFYSTQGLMKDVAVVNIELSGGLKKTIHLAKDDQGYWRLFWDVYTHDLD